MKQLTGLFKGCEKLVIMSDQSEKNNEISLTKTSIDDDNDRFAMANDEDEFCIVKIFKRLKLHYGSFPLKGRIFRRPATQKQLKVRCLLLCVVVVLLCVVSVCFELTLHNFLQSNTGCAFDTRPHGLWGERYVGVILRRVALRAKFDHPEHITPQGRRSQMVSALSNSKFKIATSGILKFSRHSSLATNAGYQNHTDTVDGITLSLRASKSQMKVSLLFVSLFYNLRLFI